MDNSGGQAMKMRFPKNDDYVAGWELAGDRLHDLRTVCKRRGRSVTMDDMYELDNYGQSAASDLVAFGDGDADMAYEGFTDFLRAQPEWVRS